MKKVLVEPNTTNRTNLIPKFSNNLHLPGNQNEPFRNFIICFRSICRFRVRVSIDAFHFAPQTTEFRTNVVQHFDVFGDDELAVVSQHSVAFGQVVGPIRAHQRLTVNADVGTFVFFLRGKVGNISNKSAASFFGHVVVALDCKLMVFVCISVILRDVVTTATQV